MQSGGDYRLFVSLPETYSDNDTTHFPVLYVLDGNGLFGLATDTHRLLRLRPEVSELIIVGIGYPVSSFSQTSSARWRDYTPSADIKADSQRAIQMGVRARGIELHSGGGQQFVATLRNEIIPFVEKRFRTTSDRGLLGHSLGGLLAAYVLVTSPELFSRYAISSPSLWWNNGETFTRETEFAKNHRALNGHVYLSAGADETKRTLSGVELFATTLRDRHYAGLEVIEYTFAAEDHDSVGPATISRALRSLYPIPAGSPTNPR